MSTSTEKTLPSGLVLPRHIAIVMDGNGRWATRRGLPRTAGHKAGAETFRSIATYCSHIGLEYLTVYAFSTENWKRPALEVRTIMELLRTYLMESCEKMVKENIGLHIIGDRSRLPEAVQELICETDELSKQTNGLRVNVALNYGSRDELVRAARKLAADAAAGNISPESITEQTVSAALDTAGIPDPDLLIRPGGEKRLSNYLLWQAAYAELYFTDTLWPDFGEDELNRAIEWFNARTRRFGGV